MGAMMIQIWEQGQTKLMIITSIKLVGVKSSWYKKYVIFNVIQKQVFEVLSVFVELSQCSVLIGSIKTLLDFRKN